MYEVVQEEIDAVGRVIRECALFRYAVGHACDRFWARHTALLGVGHFALAASRSNALAAAMIAVGPGPGDEMIIPAHTSGETADIIHNIGVAARLAVGAQKLDFKLDA